MIYKELNNDLFSFNSDKVLVNTSKFFTKFIILKVDKMKKESCLQYKALSTSVTSMSAKTLTLLLNMIKQISDDEMSRQYKERLQQKIITVAQTFLVKNTLLEN